jgi:hypothetical protein
MVSFVPLLHDGGNDTGSGGGVANVGYRNLATSRDWELVSD